MKIHFHTLLGILLTFDYAAAQQVADLEYKPEIASPAYETGKGPRVAIDEGHHNFHTADGRYKPFAELLKRDGYRVEGISKLTAESLKEVNVLVIANALNEKNAPNNWSLPTPSAFSKEEVAAMKAWVDGGGSLFLIADHMPFPGAADELAKAFGVEFVNGYAVPKEGKPGNQTFKLGKDLKESAVTKGRNEKEAVTEVMAFTGSAFQVPKGATPVLVFEKDFVALKPRQAWQFPEDTPKVAIDGWCQGAVLSAGKGRVAVFGEAAMFTAQLSGPNKNKTGMNLPAAKQNYQLLLNVLHWLSRAKGME